MGMREVHLNNGRTNSRKSNTLNSRYLICVLNVFVDAVSTSDYIESNNSRIGKQLFEHYLEVNSRGFVEVQCRYLCGGTKRNHEGGRVPTAAARVQTRVWSCGIL
jgi:hypothetical protein